MSIADDIRAAALGPTPVDIETLSWWVMPGPGGAFISACDYCDKLHSERYLKGADEVQARTFLLFVAEALS